MKPHMAYIHNTMIKKKLAENAKASTYETYRQKVSGLLQEGYPKETLIDELGNEISRIEADERDGDNIFQNGVHNAKVSCVSALRLIIKELKGDDNGILYSKS